MINLSVLSSKTMLWTISMQHLFFFWKLELGNRKNWNVSLFGLCCSLDQFSFDFPSYLLNGNQFEVFRKKNQPQNENCWTRFSEIPTWFRAGNLHGILPSHISFWSFFFFFKQSLSLIEGVLFTLFISAHTSAAFFLHGLNSAALPWQQYFFDY